MDKTLTFVIYMAVLTWLSLLAASLIQVRGWTMSGTKLALGNRESLPDATGFAGRAKRAAANTAENFMLFAAIALVAHVSGVQDSRIASGAEIFFYARVLYIPVYYAGIIYLRTALWLASVVGLGMMICALI